MATIADNKPCPVCGRWNVRAVTVDALFVYKGKILLMKRKEDPHKGKWALPGGYLEKGQTTLQAAIEEGLQEVSKRGRNPQLVGIFDDPKRHPEQAISIAYSFTVDDDSAAVGDQKEVAEVAWFSLTKLPPLAFDHQEIVRMYMRRR